MAQSEINLKSSVDFMNNSELAADLGPYIEEIQKAHALLKQIYDETEIFVSIDANTIVCQNGKVTPHLQTIDHIANISQQIEEIKLDIEGLSNHLAVIPSNLKLPCEPLIPFEFENYPNFDPMQNSHPDPKPNLKHTKRTRRRKKAT